jgi:hypothetical protein
MLRSWHLRVGIRKEAYLLISKCDATLIFISEDKSWGQGKTKNRLRYDVEDEDSQLGHLGSLKGSSRSIKSFGGGSWKGYEVQAIGSGENLAIPLS